MGVPSQFVLPAFWPIGLNVTDPVDSIPRTESKFIMPLQDIAAFLNGLLPFYNILEVNGQTLLSYSTRYFDTPGMAMYLAHHNGYGKRYKVRERTYLATGHTFLEVKYRSNTDFVSKRRIVWKQANLLPEDPAQNFLLSETPYKPEELLPTLSVTYNRVVLFNKEGAERVTLDTDIRFMNKDSSYNLSKFAIVEIKQPIKTITPALLGLRTLKKRPVSFSKYCFGVAQLYPGIKKNNFKEKFFILANSK